MDKKIQYRQIDFLRLFKLCKRYGVVKRKRKMPIEYENDINGSRGACKRLISTLIKSLFPDFKINSYVNSFYLTIPAKDRNLLAVLFSRNKTFFYNVGDEGVDALRRMEELKSNINGYIQPNLPYEIRINFKSAQIPVLPNHVSSRPQESFYKCALTCLKLKEIWYEHIAFLHIFYERESELERQREEEARQARRNRRQLERERLLREREEQEEKNEERVKALRALEEQLENERISRLEGAQSAFNRAMQQYMNS